MQIWGRAVVGPSIALTDAPHPAATVYFLKTPLL
jgi:hypothetical protein